MRTSNVREGRRAVDTRRRAKTVSEGVSHWLHEGGWGGEGNGGNKKVR